VCGIYLDPRKRIDAVYCSDKCRCRHYRRRDARRRLDGAIDLVRPRIDEQKEAWRRMERANPKGWADTPMADSLRREHLEVLRVLEGKAVRECEQCGAPRLMRRGQRYCSGRCRVAAHRLKSRA
jgi:hypothetical protein